MTPCSTGSGVPTTWPRRLPDRQASTSTANRWPTSVRRLVPYWTAEIAAHLRAGRTTLVVAHGNSLRALCMHLDGLTADQVSALNIPTGAPLHYELDEALEPLVAGGVYLGSSSSASTAPAMRNAVLASGTPQ